MRNTFIEMHESSQRSSRCNDVVKSGNVENTEFSAKQMTVRVPPRQPRHQAIPKKPSETQKWVDQVLQSSYLAVQIGSLELFLLLVFLLLLFSGLDI